MEISAEPSAVAVQLSGYEPANSTETRPIHDNTKLGEGVALGEGVTLGLGLGVALGVGLGDGVSFGVGSALMA